MHGTLDQADHAAASPTRSQRPKPHLFISLGLVFVIVVSAWLISGRAGLSQLGKGGVNQSILPKAGQLAPDVTITDLLGNQVTLSSLRGQTVWLNFWGSWCEPCRSEMPDIETAYEQVKNQGVVLLAVSLDEDPMEAALFAYQNKVTFRIFSDEYRTATDAAYPIHNFPTHIFIDKNGVVRHVVLSEMTVQDAVNYAEDTVHSA
jgi:peroxiredoxin